MLCRNIYVTKAIYCEQTYAETDAITLILIHVSVAYVISPQHRLTELWLTLDMFGPMGHLLA